MKKLSINTIKVVLFTASIFYFYQTKTHAADQFSETIPYDGEKALANKELPAVAFGEAAKQGDVDTICNMYNEKSVAYMGNPVAINGKAAICAQFKKWFAVTNSNKVRFLKNEITDIHYREINGNTLVGWGTFLMEVEVKNARNRIQKARFQGRFTDYSQKIDGKWITLLDHTSLVGPTKNDIIERMKKKR